jgi:hypothetical protein
MKFFCVGVMYSGEYDACDVTLSVYPHRVDRRWHGTNILPQNTLGISGLIFNIDK